MLGRGDVGKVYLVREKKSGKLFAMKGEFRSLRTVSPSFDKLPGSAVKEGDDRAQENQTCSDRAGNPCNRKSPIHRDPPSLLPIGAVSLLLHGVLHGWRILPRSTVKAWQMLV